MKYELLRETARDWWSVTYEAHDSQLHRRAKVTIADLSLLTPEGRAKVEAGLPALWAAAAALEHPCVAAVYDCRLEGPKAWGVEEWVTGEAMDQAMAASEALKILRPLAGTLDYTAQMGVVHANLTDASLLIRPGAPLKIMGYSSPARQLRFASGSVTGREDFEWLVGCARKLLAWEEGPGIDAVFRKAASTNPEKRFQTASQFVQALSQFVR